MGEKNNGIIDGTKEIFSIKCKVLIFAGKKDILVPYPISVQLKEVFGDNAKMITYEDSGHAVLEDHFEELCQEIKQFTSD